MSSKSIDKKFVKVVYKEEENLDLRSIVIPFSLFFLRHEKYIYDGSEKMLFSKRDPLFKSIFLQEFSDNVRNMNNKT